MTKTAKRARSPRSVECEKYPRIVFRVTQEQAKRMQCLGAADRRKIPFFLRRQLDTTLEHFSRLRPQA